MSKRYMYDEKRMCHVDEKGNEYYTSEALGHKMDKDLHKLYHYGDIEEKREHTAIEKKYQKHFEICNKLNDLYISKNKEYGDSFGKAHKEIGVISGVSDIYHKMQRLVNITKNKEEELKYESLEDTIIDLANYAVMLLTELELEKCNKE